MLALAGAPDDPNLLRLARSAERRAWVYRWAAVDRRRPPSVLLDPAGNALTWQGVPFDCRSVFIRPDAFGVLAERSPEEEARAGAWFTTLWAWVAASPEVHVFNRDMAWAALNKPLVLRLARACELAIPETRVTNSLGDIRASRDGEWAVKPIDGGGYCCSWESLADAHTEELSIQPAIFQERLAYPELRIFVVGDRLFGYEINSTQIDYRRDRGAKIRPLADLPADLQPGLLRLARLLRLDWAAADLKYSPRQGRFVFLEINCSPMFAAFDRLDGGRLSGAILDALSCLTG